MGAIASLLRPFALPEVSAEEGEPSFREDALPH